MQSSRREFVQASLSASLMTALPVFQSSEPKRVLILGGTGFLGPALIDAVLARGHKLTLFNTGTTEARRKDSGRPSVIPEGVEVLLGNRDPKLTVDDRRLRGDPDIEKKRDPNSPKGLTNLKNRQWDAVIDTSGYFPRMVRASAELLAPSVGQYIFISTLSVYAHTDKPGMDETTELATLEDPTTEDFGPQFQNYGGGKALCEAAAEKAMPGRVANIRPGFIVGPRDTSRRFLWWPWRVAQGGEMIVPGTAEDPVQFIDVRDLAEWTVHCIEEKTCGVFNATGPAEELTMGRLIQACISGSPVDTEDGTTPVWLDPALLAEQGLSFPIWVSPEGETAGFHRTSIQRALQAGLRFRSAEVTARDTYLWYAGLPEDLQSRVLPGITLEAEAAALKLLK